MSNDLRDALLSGTLSLCSEGDVRVLRIEWCGDDRHDQADAAFDALEALAAPPQPAQVQHILDEAPSGSEVGSQSDGLLPCPFCGSNDLDFSSSNSIDCNVCGGSMYHGARLDDPDEEERVTTAWNTRAVPAPAPEVARVVAKLRHLGKRLDDFAMLNGEPCAFTKAANMLSTLSARLAEVEGERDALLKSVGGTASPAPPSPTAEPGCDLEGVTVTGETVRARLENARRGLGKWQRDGSPAAARAAIYQAIVALETVLLGNWTPRRIPGTEGIVAAGEDMPTEHNPAGQAEPGEGEG